MKVIHGLKSDYTEHILSALRTHEINIEFYKLILHEKDTLNHSGFSHIIKFLKANLKTMNNYSILVYSRHIF